jgi:integrase
MVLFFSAAFFVIYVTSNSQGTEATRRIGRGQAPALSQSDWDNWVQHCLSDHTCQLYVLLTLTAMFALRVGEACMLCDDDFQLDHDPPKLRIPPEQGRGKSPGDIPIVPEQLAKLQELRTQVLRRKRYQKNQYGSHETLDVFEWSKEGRVFPTTRGLESNHITVRGITKAVKKLASSFGVKFPGNGFERIRSHSGRATRITLHLGEGMPLALSMKFARHAPSSVATHLQYGRLTVKDIYKYLEEHRATMANKLAGTPATLVRKHIVDDSTSESKVDSFLGDATLPTLVAWRKQKLLSARDFAIAKAALFKKFCSRTDKT